MLQLGDLPSPSCKDSQENNNRDKECAYVCVILLKVHRFFVLRRQWPTFSRLV